MRINGYRWAGGLCLWVAVLLPACEQWGQPWYRGQWQVDMARTRAVNGKADKGPGDLVGVFKSFAAEFSEGEMIEITADRFIEIDDDGDQESRPYTVIAETADEVALSVDGDTQRFYRDGDWLYVKLSANLRAYYKRVR